MVTGGYKGLKKFKRHCRELQESTRDCKELQEITCTRGKKGLHGETGYYKGLQGAKGYCYTVGDLTCTKGYKGKGYPPPPHPDKGKTERGSICERLERGKRGLQGVSKSALHFSMSSFSSF